MASSTEELRTNIKDEFLSCKICLDDLKYPKTLPCLHTFCAECIHYYIEHNNVDGRKFSCPVCRRQIYIPKNGVDGFPDSFFVASLGDMVSKNKEDKFCGICKFRNDLKQAAALCVECKIQLCDDCQNTHHTTKVTEGHTLLPIAEGSLEDNRENYCRVHRGETIKYYCETCNSPICLPCTFLDHKGHQIEEIKNVRDTFNQDMTGLVMQSKDNITQLTQTKADLVELENELFMRKEQVKTDVRKGVQDIMRCLNEQEAQLMNELDDFYDIISISRDRQKLERTIFRLERAHDFAEQLLSSDTSPIAQIVNRGEAKDGLQQALNFKLPEVSIHASKLVQNSVFLPGHYQLHLGSLLKCSGGSGTAVSSLRPVLPSTRATYMHTLKSTAGLYTGEILSIAFLPSGNPVILTSTDKKVKVFTKRGNIKYEFGDVELQHPSDVTVTRDGNIAVSDCGLLCVKVFDKFGTLRREFGSREIFQLPIALTTDQTGKFLVCDQIKQRITIHMENGELFKSFETPEIRMPHDVCCYINRLYICDGESKEVGVYSYHANQNEYMQFMTKLTTPDCISKNSIVTENGQGNEGIMALTSDGLSQQNVEHFPLTGEFLDCSAVCTDVYGNILIADGSMNRIHMMNERGEMSSIIPRGHPVRRPTSIAVSAEGLLAVVQQGVDAMDTDLTSLNHVVIFKIMKADV